MNKTFIEEFSGDYARIAIEKANEYAANNRLEIVAIDAHYLGVTCWLMVVFKRGEHE